MQQRLPTDSSGIGIGITSGDVAFDMELGSSGQAPNKFAILKA